MTPINQMAFLTVGFFKTLLCSLSIYLNIIAKKAFKNCPHKDIIDESFFFLKNRACVYVITILQMLYVIKLLGQKEQ